MPPEMSNAEAIEMMNRCKQEILSLRAWRGNQNNYRTSDLAFGVRLDDGAVIELK